MANLAFGAGGCRTEMFVTQTTALFSGLQPVCLLSAI